MTDKIKCVRMACARCACFYCYIVGSNTGADTHVDSITALTQIMLFDSFACVSIFGDSVAAASSHDSTRECMNMVEPSLID